MSQVGDNDTNMINLEEPVSEHHVIDIQTPRSRLSSGMRSSSKLPEQIEEDLRERLSSMRSIDQWPENSSHEIGEASFRPASFVNLLKNQQELLLVLDVRADGTHDYMELRRDDIFDIARERVPEMAKINQLDDRMFRATFLEVETTALNRKRGSTYVHSAALEKYRLRGTLQKRDLRLLDGNFKDSKDPAIVVRRHAMIINIQPMKVLVLYDRCILFIPDGADFLLRRFMQLVNERQDSADFSFPIRVLESSLLTLSEILEDEFSLLQPEVASTLKEVLHTQSGVTLERLRQAKSAIAKQRNRLEGIQHAFEEILQNDRDMALMDLDKVHKNPEKYVEARETEWSLDHESTEILLESYGQTVDGILLRVDVLRQELEAAIASITLRLDTARNKLLGVELLISSFTSVAAIGALFAGLFGMNLESGVEDADGWFWGWFAAIMISVPVFVFLMFKWIVYKGLLIN